MLPHLIASHSQKKERAEAIGEVLRNTDYDVIFFQEAFHPLARKKILAALREKFPYQMGPANQRRLSLIASSGLWVFSRYPIVRREAIVYQHRFGVDALSRKGALLVELNVDGQPLQVVGTHLQNCGSPTLKRKQCMELFDRLVRPAMRDGVPQVICGDFNIDRYRQTSDYDFMLGTLDARDSNTDPAAYSYDRVNNDMRTEKGDGKDLIDYILIRENGGTVAATPALVRFQKRWRPAHSDLSDHYSVSAEIRFTPRPVTSLALLKE